MEVDSLAVTTIEKSVDLAVQSTDYINGLKHISIHMVENMKDEWIGGYNCTRMNERGSSTSRLLICDKDISCFHVEVQEKSS
jgi:hypothetical protein